MTHVRSFPKNTSSLMAALLLAFSVLPGPAQTPAAKPALAPSRGTNSPASTGAAAPPASSTNLGTNLLDGSFQLSIGDRLSFRIEEDKEEARALMVTDSGDLEVPYIGRVAAAGKSCRQLGAEIKVKLEEEYYYQATVILSLDQFNHTRGKVYLVGYVRVPGPQEIPSDEVFTLSKAVMRAGGFNDFADKKKVRITRKGSSEQPEGKILEVDVGAVIEGGKAEKDVKLEPGDIVYVPGRLFKF